jgi:radical SAM superfamily enzyme YgiQ (UPF0313 family)
MPSEIILVNPSYAFPPFTEADRRAIRDDPFMMDLPSDPFLYPPMGLLSMANVLRQNGFAVDGIDCNATRMTMEQLARRCEGAKVVGIQLLVANTRSVYQLVKHMKGRGYEIVIGGPWPSVEPEVVAKMGLKYGISGEGEISFTRLCDALIRGNGKPEDIPGIIIAEDTATEEDPRVYTRTPELINNLNDWLPDRSFMRSPLYRQPFKGRIEVALGSRGCPYNCIFCYCSSPSPNQMFNRSRWVDVDVFVRDLSDTLKNYGPRYIEFLDETFTVNRKWVKEVCQGITEAKLKFEWGAKTRMDLLDPELLETMGRAGCTKIGFGLESGVYDHRKNMRKDFGNDKVKELFDAANKFHIDPACTIIFGHPDETEADMWSSVEMVKSVDAAYVEFHIMVLIPKTTLYYRAIKEGKASPETFDRFMRGEVGYPEYAPGDLTPLDMRRIHREAINKFYLRPGYVARQATRARRPGDLLQYARAAMSIFKKSSASEPIWRLGRALPQ